MNEEFRAALVSGGGPQTEAGQVLLRDMVPDGPDFPATDRRGYRWWLAMILSIEAQARTAAILAGLPAVTEDT